MKIRRDVKRTMPEQGSSERGGNDEARGRSHLSLAMLKGTYLSTTIEFLGSLSHVNKSVSYGLRLRPADPLENC